MEKKSFLKVIILLFSVFFTGEVFAATETDVREFLNETGEGFIQTLGLVDKAEKYARIDEMIDEHVNSEYMGRFALGQYWRGFDDGQKQTYLSLFKRYLKSLYKAYPLDFETKGIGFEISTISQKGNFWDATCVIELPEQYRTENFEKVSVVFKIEENAEKFYLVDLKIGEASMLVTLRGRLTDMFKNAEDEIGWFLEDFEDLTKSNEQRLVLEN